MSLGDLRWIPHIVDVLSEHAGICNSILEFISADHRRLLIFTAVERQLSAFFREEAAEIRAPYLALLEFQRDNQIYSSHSSLESSSSSNGDWMMGIEFESWSDRSG